MQSIINYIKENLKIFLFLVLVVTVVLIISLGLNDTKKGKIYASDPFVYTKESFGAEENTKSKLPFINVKGSEIDSINDELFNMYYEINTIGKEFMTYEYYKSKNILSLIVTIRNIKDYDSYSSKKHFYNVDIKKGTVIEDNDLIGIFGLSSDDVDSLINNKLREYYDYEIKKSYVSSSCDFDCYLKFINGTNILDDYEYYVKNNHLYVYKHFMLDSNFFYDSKSGFDLFNFDLGKIK